jgi:serine/threonine protein kinase
VYEVAEDDQYIYVVSEYSSGQELFNEIIRRIREHCPFAENEVQGIVR